MLKFGALFTGLVYLVLTQLNTFGGAVAGPVAPGLDAMEHPELLPLFPPDGTETRQSSSYDPGGSNNDGNFTNAYTKYVDTNGEYVIFDASGPGCLYRQQINVWSRGRKKAAGLSHIKYYFDDEPRPRVDMTIDDLFGGKAAPFTEPFTFLDPRPRFGISYYPFVFKKRLKVTTTDDFSKLPDPNACWYQYTYLTFAETNGVNSWAGPQEDSPVARNQWTHLGLDPKPAAGNITESNSVTIPNGKSAVLAELHGAGSITSVKLRLDPYGRKEFYHTSLRIYWDGAKRPAVDIPIGLFFGGGGETYANCRHVPEMSLQSLFYGFDGTNHDAYCYWPMPFWDSARLELVNESGVDLKSVCEIQYKPSAVLAYPKGQSGYFCARRTLARDPGHGLFNTVFDESGQGRVVGISFYSMGYAMDGDEFTYIDGSRTPQIHGDGTEDDHNQGYGGDAYQKPLWGGLVNGYQTAYRFYYNDSYFFNQHIRINYEFSREGGHDNGGETDVVVYYYKNSASGNLLLTDQVDVGNPASESAHHYSVAGQTWAVTRRSGYDGYERDYEYDTCQDDGRAFNGSSEFTVNVSRDNHGVELRRRLYRPGNGQQRALVYVDGVRVSERPWDVVTQSSAPDYQGWYDADFEIPAAYTQGKRQLRLRIENVGDVNSDINEFYYWVYCYQAHPPAKVRRVRKLTGVSNGAFRVDLRWAPARLADQVNYYLVERAEKPDFSHAVQVGRSNPSHFSDLRVQPNTTYYYRVAAVGLSGATGLFLKPIAVTTAPTTQTATATFLGTDETTQGDWPGKYGKDGFYMPRYFYGRDCQAWPDYLCAVDPGSAFTNRQFAIWRNSTKSSLLTSPISYCARYLGALETPGSGSVTLYVSDARPHQLALYVCDFDKAGREETIELEDLNGHALAPTCTVSGFEQGKWLRFKFSGSIQVHVASLKGNLTAVLSALMFDKAP
jgi:hypothetical protein